MSRRSCLDRRPRLPLTVPVGPASAPATPEVEDAERSSWAAVPPAAGLSKAGRRRGPARHARPTRGQRTAARPNAALGGRGLIFALLCLVCATIAGGSILVASRRATSPGMAAPPDSGHTAAGDRADAAAAGQPGAAAGPGGVTLSLESPGAVPLLLFRSTARDESYGRLALAPLDAPERRSPVSVPGVPHEPGGRGTLSCDRVHFSAGSGLCLAADRGVITTYKAIIFDAALRPRHTIPLGGVPSRARVSPDGRYAAMTVFVSGHSYADGGFSTLTTLLDTASGELIADLEAFDVLRDGQRISSPDFNFWGVTFARESNRFYATLGTAGHTYLVEGDVAARQVRILRDGVECPSLSPDNRRIAFKRQVGSAGRLLWQPAVLDLATLAETPLPLETRNVDDQMEWLDDGHLVYGLPADGEAPSAATNLWTLAVDGSAPPRLLLGQAWSPAVIQGRPLAP